MVSRDEADDDDELLDDRRFFCGFSESYNKCCGISLTTVHTGLVGWLGFNGPLRQYFSLNRAISQRGRKRRKKIEESKNVQTKPHLYLLQAQ